MTGWTNERLNMTWHSAKSRGDQNILLIDENLNPMFIKPLKCMSMHPCLSVSFTKGNNFCDSQFACLDDKSFQNGVYTYGKEFAPLGANSFL